MTFQEKVKLANAIKSLEEEASAKAIEYSKKIAKFRERCDHSEKYQEPALSDYWECQICGKLIDDSYRRS